VVEVTAPPKTNTTEIDQTIVQAEFSRELTAITDQNSVVSTPEVRWSKEQAAAWFWRLC